MMTMRPNEEKKYEINAVLGFQYGVKHILVDRPSQLIPFLGLKLDLSLEEVNFLLHLGSIYVNHKRTLEDIPLDQWALVRAHTKPRRFPTQIPLENLIQFESEDFLVIDKPSGIPVHATVDNVKENLLALIPKNLHITHRLDVPTSGLLVFAKTILFQSQFNQLLSKGLVSKYYRALVLAESVEMEKLGPIPLKLQHYMISSPRAPKKVTLEPSSDSKLCELRILSKKPSQLGQNLYELKIELITGRTHQIRAQLSAQSFPLLGDSLYGGRALAEFPTDQRMPLLRWMNALPNGEAIGLRCERIHFPAPLQSGAYLDFSIGD